MNCIDYKLFGTIFVIIIFVTIFIISAKGNVLRDASNYRTFITGTVAHCFVGVFVCFGAQVAVSPSE